MSELGDFPVERPLAKHHDGTDLKIINYFKVSKINGRNGIYCKNKEIKWENSLKISYWFVRSRIVVGSGSVGVVDKERHVLVGELHHPALGKVWLVGGSGKEIYLQQFLAPNFPTILILDYLTNKFF